MSAVIYNESNRLPDDVTGYDLVVIDYNTLHGGAVLRNVGHLLINNGRTLTASGYGFALMGGASIVTNEGTIQSSGEGVIRIGPGALTLVNLGTIISYHIAVVSNDGNDRIINAGILETKRTDGTSAVLDLKGGDDFYDGMLGTAIGGAILLGSGNDTAYGGAGAESFFGGEGSDFIDGGAGSDTISGGADSDTINGGAGTDTVDYSGATAGVTVDLGKTTAQAISGGQGTDTLIDVENVTGSVFGDKITGNAADNSLQGGDGNDTLDGAAGNDSLVGGDGNDSLVGGAGDDILEGGVGDDTLEGGTGNDRIDGGGINTVRYSGSAGVKADLTRGDGQITVGAGVDTLIGITHLEGGSGKDVFTGNDAGNRLVGNSGDDTLEGGGGNDTLEGGAGEDMAVFFGASTEYRITPDTASGTTIVADTVGGAVRDGIDTLKDVRLVKFSDKIIALTNGNPTDISFSGTSVAEDKAAGSVLGTVRGTDPDDDDLTFSLVSNANGTFGLNGKGELVLMSAFDYETAAQHTISIKAEDKYGGIRTETFTISVRNVIETSPLIRSGTSTNEQLVGEAGDDKLFGLGGNDVLFGQIGNDTLIGGAGRDTLTGGAGKDVFVFDHKPNTKSNLDYTQDFNPADDVIHLSRKIFSKIDKGALKSKAFVIGNQFKDKDDRILYYKEGGALFYDPDGSGSAKAIQFASIGKGLKVSHKDFFVI